MSVVKIPVQINVPKESKDVIDALVVLIADLKAKKSLVEISSDMLPRLLVAVEGYDQLGDELKSDGRDDLAAYAVSQILGALGA